MIRDASEKIILEEHTEDDFSVFIIWYVISIQCFYIYY